MDAEGTDSGEPGSLSVGDTHEIIPIINNLRTEKECRFDVVVRSEDFHPENHVSFEPTHGLEPFAHLAGKGELPLMCVNPESGMATDGSCCPTYHIESYDCDTMLCPVIDSSKPLERTMDAVLSTPACTICLDSPEDCFETTQAMWTNHCLQDGDSTFPSTLLSESTDIVVQKGGNEYLDSYSAFMDNTKKIKTELDDVLKDLDVGTVYILGIATD